jgi:hypothetical protein
VLYESKYTDLTVLVRSESVQYHSATGVEIGRVKPLTAEFGFHGGERMVVNPITNELEPHALIYGRYYDTEEAKERLGWTDDEHEAVVYTLDKLCREQPFLIARVEHEIPAIVKPWPTYDETHWKTIPVLAEQLGLLDTTLAYERENKNREAIVSVLEEKLSSEPRSENLTSAPAEDLITLES